MPRVEKKKTAAKLGKTPTGIHGLDEITGGGLPQGRPTLICGGAGSGKTMLAMTFLEYGARKCNEPGVFFSFEETEKELETNFASLGYNLTDLIEHKKIIVDFVFVEKSEIEETGEYDLEGLFIRLGTAIDEIGAKRVVLDTVEALFAGLSDTGILRAELRRLFRWLKARGVTTVITGERGDGTLTRQGLEEYVSDCVILLDHRIADDLATRRLRIIKYRGSSHGNNEYPFNVDETGISLLPLSSMGLTYEAGIERVSSGIQELDQMLSGKGYYRGSSILVTGMAGTGKSSVGAQFVNAGCSRGERCLYFATEESPSQITRNMRSIGIDLERWVKKGLLEFVAARANMRSLEEHLLVLQRTADAFKPSLVVVDAITDFSTMGTGLAVKWMTTRMVDFFKSRGITTIFNSLVTGAYVEDSGVGVSSTMDVWMHLVNVPSDLERNRIMYIIKSRGMAHSNQVREFLITNEGVKLMEVYTGPSGALLGSARLAQGAAEKRAALDRKQEMEVNQKDLFRKRTVLEAQIASLRADFEAQEGEAKRIAEHEREREREIARDVKEMAVKRHVGGGRTAK
ncbi:MAG: circadian clock protein KaiC [Dehalococcoidia bacterium]|jgi:circadian clock protein KaiC